MGDPNKVRVNVFLQGAATGGKAVIITRDTLLDECTARCCDKLQIDPAKRSAAFLLDAAGARITDIAALLAQPNAVIYLATPTDPNASASTVDAAAPSSSTDQQHQDPPVTVTVVASSSSSTATAPPTPAAVVAKLKESSRPGYSLDLAVECASFKGHQSCTLTATVSTPPPTNRKTLLIIVADQSGSMRPAWHQVQQGLLYIAEENFQAEADSAVSVEVVLYQTTAKRLVLTKEGYEAAIMAEEAHGNTCFASAFDMIGEIWKEYRGKVHDLIVGFMTDGSHTTARSAGTAYKQLRTIINTDLPKTCTSVVHTIGFTENHRFEDLDRIRRELGSLPGSFMYADRSDGRTALRRKLETLFDVASLFGGKLSVDFSLVPPFLFIAPDGSRKETIRGVDMVLNRDGLAQATFSVECTDPVALEKEKERLFSSGRCVMKDDQGEIVAEAATQMTLKIVDTSAARFLFSLRTLANKVEAMHSAITKLQGRPTDDVIAQFNKDLKEVQDEVTSLDESEIFALPRQYRSTVLELRTLLNQQVAQILDILAHFARDAFSSATKARLADLAFGGSFKANRQRRVDRRISRNALLLKSDSEKLEKLNVDLSKTEGASTTSKEFFSCIMSLCDWRELMEEKDICGFGLAVTRPEWVIDDPTQMRILAISNTCLAKSAMEDALRCAIDLHGHMKVTGGFAVGAEMGVAIRGRGREPINSWLPLYIHADHWASTRILLKQILGYFVALDPLAYATGQAEVLYLVLGTMAARVSSSGESTSVGCGEHALRLLYQFQRTCLEVSREFNLAPSFEETITKFIKTCPYETRDQVKNLVSLAAYLLVLPLEVIDRIFPTQYEWIRFWTNIAAVAIRRSAFTIFGDLGDNEEDAVAGLLDRLIHGIAGDEKLTEEQFEALLAKHTRGSNIPADTFEDLKIPEPQSTDPEVLAEHEVQDTFQPPHAFTKSSGQAIARLIAQMERRGYPTITAITSIVKFTSNYIKMYRSHAETNDPAQKRQHILEELDATWGIAPDVWITRTRESCAAQDVQQGTIYGLLSAIYSSSQTCLRTSASQPQQDGGASSSSTTEVPVPVSVVPGVPSLSIMATALVGMGVRWRVNKPARDAIDAGAFMEPFLDPNRCITTIHQELRTEHLKRVHALQLSIVAAKRAEDAIASADDTQFASWLSSLMPTRFANSFPTAMSNLISKRAKPGFVGKLRIFFSGKIVQSQKDPNSASSSSSSSSSDPALFTVDRVFPGGIWLPGKRYTNKLWGDSLMQALILVLSDHFFSEKQSH